MKIIEQFGFKIKGKKPRKEKRIHEIIMAFDEAGWVLETKKCLPDERDKTITEIFEGNEKVAIINIRPLRGRTKVIRRNPTIE